MARLNPKILNHFQNPRNIGVIECPDGFASYENPVNGYTTSMYLKIQNNIIEDVKVKTMGCVSTIASASAISQAVKGFNISTISMENGETYQSFANQMEKEIGQLPSENWHCLPTAIQVVLNAVLNYYEKKEDIVNQEKLKKIISEISHDIDMRLKQEINNSKNM